ncbi:MAG: hypothetical protein L6V91_10305 [Bacilli bacterium]|nr:MAG: hypothetical protein L6V91_10305 [Bacilli bacterium]
MLKGDILNSDTINDNDVKDFINPNYYEKNLLKIEKNKDDFLLIVKSTILFGIPSNLIEGILVGRKI